MSSVAAPTVGYDGVRRARTRAGAALATTWSNGSLRFGVGLLAVLLTVTVVAPLFLPDPNHQDLTAVYLPPGTDGHLFGTDSLGRDVFAWCAVGIRTSLLISVCAVLLAALIGVTAGLVAGYFGGIADTLLMRLVDLWLAVPPLLLLVAASAVIDATLVNLVLLIGIATWVPYARLVRARILAERELPYIAAARLAGAKRRRILMVHLLRASVTVTLVILSLQMGLAVLWESALSFLGLGVQPPTVSLGAMLNEGRGNLVGSWWIAVCSGLTLVAIIVAFNSIGDGLRDVFHEDEEVER